MADEYCIVNCELTHWPQSDYARIYLSLHIRKILLTSQRKCSNIIMHTHVSLFLLQLMDANLWSVRGKSVLLNCVRTKCIHKIRCVNLFKKCY